jgi:serine/threonine protein kinase
MALIKGAKKCFELLRTRHSGDLISRADVEAAAGWSPASLNAYLGKNKLAPFLLELRSGQLKVLMDGIDLTEQYFDEVFSQKAPSKVVLTPGETIVGKRATYALIEPLGAGAVGQVWSASMVGSSTKVAIKVMLPKADLLAESKLGNVRVRFRREARNGAKLSHPHVVSYLDVGEVRDNPFLAMELGDASIGRELKVSGPFSEVHAKTVIREVAEGLTYLHSLNLPHRDVKPENIIRFGTTTKLGDLGIVKWTDFDPTFTTGGTITRDSIQLGSWYYMAPEQQRAPHEASAASDIYALGVSWIELLTGAAPPPQASISGDYELPGASEVVKAIVARMLAYKTTERPSLVEVIAATV